MKPTESVSLTTALQNIAKGYSPSAPIQHYINKWLADVTAMTNGDKGSVALTNVDPGGTLVCPVSALPSASGNNNAEIIVTDATVATNATIVAGGGSTRVLVRSNNTNWLIV